MAEEQVELKVYREGQIVFLADEDLLTGLQTIRVSIRGADVSAFHLEGTTVKVRFRGDPSLALFDFTRQEGAAAWTRALNAAMREAQREVTK